MRRWLLEQGHTKEAIIKRDDVHVGDWVLTSNGLEGCSIGQVVGKL
jgi:4-amino-4-deoxychorismate lyase